MMATSRLGWNPTQRPRRPLDFATPLADHLALACTGDTLIVPPRTLNGDTGHGACTARLPEMVETLPRIDLHHLPADAEHFLGRAPELEALDTAWAEGSATSVVELIAPGGTGKTALVKRWLDGLRTNDWLGASRVFGWSFYSQGTGEDRQASEDPFLAAATQWFGMQIEPSANPVDKGRALADCICCGRTLLILDGLEPLQYPPGPLAGELRAPGLQALLTQLAAAGHPGLCVLTSREWVQDLAGAVRGDTHPQGPVLRLDLGNLCDP
ncbi:WD repeat-containing protein, partial [Thiorhodococcus drewsii AZ1]